MTTLERDQWATHGLQLLALGPSWRCDDVRATRTGCFLDFGNWTSGANIRYCIGNERHAAWLAAGDRSQYNLAPWRGVDPVAPGVHL